MSQAIKDLLNDDNKLTNVAQTAFAQVDKNGSGVIDFDEIEKYLIDLASELGAEPISKDEVMKVVKSIDMDESGKLEFGEFKDFFVSVLNVMVGN